MNRLASAYSPYLLQHKDNPVDWWEWSEEAFAEARRRDVPVLLSVGYAACHWCHVMAHESFEDDETAALINQYTVPIKVDREERPDVDAVYMEATQAMTGQGGWPMTVFATPTGEPFFCGTYFPKPHFQRLIAAVAEAWATKREDAIAQGRNVVEALTGGALAPGHPLDAKQLDTAASTFRRDYDETNKGFGGAPKFPPSMGLEFLLRHHARTGDPDSRKMVAETCAAMARGGMYDQLGGGFARYAVDATWTVPHFEKMLYDNALLLRVYLHLWRATGDALALRVARETAEFLVRDLRTPEGGFASALDADTDGVEGLTYAWTPAQLVETLGDTDGTWAAALLGVTSDGTFEHGTSVLQLRQDPDDADRWATLRGRLLTARDARPQPARDDKVVAAWNGLAIAALAEFGELTSDRTYVDAAARAADLLLELHLVDGRLRRTSRDGRVGPHAGVLEDHGDVAEGLLVLHQVTGEARWLESAGELLETALTRFADGSGGFYDTADDAETLIRRPQDPTDNATPSGSSAVAGALLTYAALTASIRHREAAEAALEKMAPVAERFARFAGWACAVGEAAVAGPLQVAVVGSGADADELRAVAWRGTAPGTVVVAGEPDADGVPLLADRPLVGGEPAAYVCRGFVCDRPTTDPATLVDQVR
ncbi:thioredoxin domain-containing protein [Cryptosporangium phraense]|uniref:Thioredoxin domain-containing protein n=1 Tax=Cryptosporangium phraense TaxID=2593070 RepID=A0A545AYY9_9ACTN|nr:thioredoxin domain-containing protein [Cryptosporangium phraense]TQS46546.1 thioredoxin domain-containing protein [Cryptosporangium phraense]